MNTIMQDWAKCRSRGIIPMFEIELINDEWLLVHLDVTETSIEFNFDIEHGEPRFDGDVIGENGYYRIDYDPEYDTLDRLLEYVMDNITEGYIGVYNLYPLDDE